jgi:hypothetical protein
VKLGVELCGLVSKLCASKPNCDFHWANVRAGQFTPSSKLASPGRFVVNVAVDEVRARERAFP